MPLTGLSRKFFAMQNSGEELLVARSIKLRATLSLGPKAARTNGILKFAGFIPVNI
jgi:hypothetical protein